MATLARKARDFKSTTRLARPGFSREQEYEAVNTEALRGILSYLKYLYAEGEISDKAYQALVSQALSTFVENSVYSKVNLMLGTIDHALEEVEEVLLSDILS